MGYGRQRQIYFIASSISSDITCNLGLFFLIFGFGVITLAALFMRLFRLRKAFSTSLAVSKVTKTYTRETNNNRS
jgi:predicted cation transporter